MNVRTRNPAAGTARTRTSGGDTLRTAYISAISARYGTTDVVTSSAARLTSGFAYGASVSRQNPGSSRSESSAIERVFSPTPEPRLKGVQDRSGAEVHASNCASRVNGSKEPYGDSRPDPVPGGHRPHGVMRGARSSLTQVLLRRP